MCIRDRLNVGQQVGGSIGLALLGTIAATVTKNQLATVALTHSALAHAVVAGYSAALEVSTAITILAFVIALVVVRSRSRLDVDAIPNAA